LRFSTTLRKRAWVGCREEEEEEEETSLIKDLKRHARLFVGIHVTVVG